MARPENRNDHPAAERLPPAWRDTPRDPDLPGDTLQVSQVGGRTVFTSPEFPDTYVSSWAAAVADRTEVPSERTPPRQ